MDHHSQGGVGAARQSSVSSTTSRSPAGVEDIDDEAWLSKYLPEDLLKIPHDPEATLEFIRTHNPLMSQMSAFLSRKLRMVLTRPGVASVHHTNTNNPSPDDPNNKLTTASLPPKAVLTARLFCAAADGDVSLLADTTEKIRLWYKLTQHEERQRKEASEVEAHQRAKRKTEAALQKKLEQAQLMEERDARRALTTTMLAVQLKDEEEAVASGVCRTKSTGFGRTHSWRKREAAANPNSIMMSSATTALSIGGVMSGEWDEWPKDAPSSSSALHDLNSFPSFPTTNSSQPGCVVSGSGGGGGVVDTEGLSFQSAFSNTFDNAASVHDPSSRRSSLIPTAIVSRAGSMEFRNHQNSRRRSSGYYLSDQLRRIYSVPSMAGSGCEDEESIELPLSGSKNHLSANNLTVQRGVVASTRRGSTIDQAVDFMHDDSSDGGSGKDEDVFDAGAEQARNLEALERAISNTVPFLHMPFNILHYAAYSNSPEVVEYILANQDVIEKLGATVSASAQARVYRYNANKQIAQAASMAQAKATPGMGGNLPPHNDPSSIHYYTHFADGKPVLTNHVADGSSPLHIAAVYNNPQMLRLLMAAGGDCKLCRGRSITPLYDCMWLPSATLFAQHANLMVTRVLAIRQVHKFLSSPSPDQQDDLNGSNPFFGSTLLGSGSTGSMTLPMLSTTYGLSATYNDLSALSTSTNNRNGDSAALLPQSAPTNIDLTDALSVNRLLLTSGLHTSHIDGCILTSPIPWRKECSGAASTHQHRRTNHGTNANAAHSSRMLSKTTTALPYGIKLLPVPTTNEGIASYGDEKKNSVDHTTPSSVSPEWMFDGANATDGGCARNVSGGKSGSGTTTNHHQLLAVSGVVHPPFHAFVLSNPLYASMYLLLASGSDPSFGGCGAVYPPTMEGFFNPLQTLLDDDLSDPNKNSHNSSLQQHHIPSSREGTTAAMMVDALMIDSMNPDPMNLILLGGGGDPSPHPSSKPLTKASLMRIQNSQNEKYSEDLAQFLEATLNNVRTEELVQRHRRAKGTAGATGLTTLTGGALVGVEPVPVQTIERRAARSEDYTQQLLEATTQSGGHSDSNELSLTGNSVPPTTLIIPSLQRKGQPSGGGSPPTVENSGASAVSQFLRMRFLLNQSGKTGIASSKKRKSQLSTVMRTAPTITAEKESSPQPSGGRPPLLPLPSIQARPSSSRLSVSSEAGYDHHAGSHSLSPKGSSGPVPNLVGFSLPPVHTDRPSLCYPPSAAPASPMSSLPPLAQNQDRNSPSSGTMPHTAVSFRNQPFKRGPPIPVKVGDFVAISTNHFRAQKDSVERVTGAVAIRLFDETVARSTVVNIPSRYVQLQADACVALIQKRQVGMPSVEIDEHYRQHSAALKSAANGSPSSPATKNGLFRDKARLLTHTVGGLRSTQKPDRSMGDKTTPQPNVLRRQSMAVSFVRLPKVYNTATPSGSNNFHPPGQQYPFTSSTSYTQASELDGSGSASVLRKAGSSNKCNSRHRQSISQLVPMQQDKLLVDSVSKGVTSTTETTTAGAAPSSFSTKCNLSRGFHTLLGNSVIGKVSFVGKLPDVVLTRWLKSRSQSTTLSPSFEGLVSNNPATFHSALGSMLSSLQQHKTPAPGGGGGGADEEEWFVGIVLEYKMASSLQKATSSAARPSSDSSNVMLGNCDGTYFGNGKRYFSAVETVGAQLQADAIKNVAVESKRQQQQQMMASSESSSLSRSNSIVGFRSLRKSQVRESDAAFEQMVVACNGERCAMFVPLCLIDKVFTSDDNMSGDPSHPLVSTQVSENTEVRRRWTSSWKQAIARHTKEAKSPIHHRQGSTTSMNAGGKRHGFTDAAKELKLLMRDYNAKKKAEEVKFNSRN